jgi:hypothetical protein
VCWLYIFKDTEPSSLQDSSSVRQQGGLPGPPPRSPPPCLDPRSHRNARACSFAARLTRSDDLLQQGTRELCALARSVEQGAEPRALSASRYGTRYAKWAGGSRSQRHTDGPLRAALLKTTLRCEGLEPDRNLQCCSSAPQAASIFARYRYRWYRSNTACHGVWSKASSGGVLARALPEGLRYLST